MKKILCLIIILLICPPSFATCVCPDETEGLTTEELKQQQTDLEINLHNMQVENQRAEAVIQDKIVATKIAISVASIIAEPPVEIDQKVY